MNKRKNRIIFVQSNEEIELLPKLMGPNTLIFAPTPQAQIALIERGIPYDNYIQLLPSAENTKKIVSLANSFSFSWASRTGLDQTLKVAGVDISYYMVGYLTNLLIPMMVSLKVFENLIARYRPKEIIFFTKYNNTHFSQLLNTDVFVLENCATTLFDANTKITKISLPGINKTTNRRKINYLSQFSLKNIGLFMDNKIYDLFTYPKAEMLLYADKHILINSIDLIKKIRRRHSLAVFGSLLNSDQKKKLLLEKIKYFDFDRISARHYDGQIAQITREWDRHSKDSSFDLFLDSYGMLEIKRAIIKIIGAYLATDLSNIFKKLTQARRIISEVRPKSILLFGNYGKTGLSLCYAGREAGAKIILLEHGITSAPRQAHPPIFDKMLVWGKITKDIYQSYLKVKPEKIAVVGNFFTDPGGSPRTYFTCRPMKPRIGFVLSIYLPDYPKQVKIISEVIEELERNFLDYELVIRPHPGDPLKLSADFFVRLAKKGTVIIDSALDFHEILEHSDLIIIQSSTLALEAMLLGKPIIHLVTHGVTDITKFHKYGASIKISNREKLGPKIKQLLTNKKTQDEMFTGQRKLLRDYFHKFDGGAAQRVIKAIC